MNEIILSEEIISRLEDLGISQDKMNMKVFKYFLERNIKIIFGNDLIDQDLIEFDMIRLKNENPEGTEKKKEIKNILVINFLSKKYVLWVANNRTSLIMDNIETFSDNLDNLKRNTVFQISSRQNVMCNYVVDKQEDLEISEYQNIKTGKNRSYNYQKRVTTKDGDVKDYPFYNLKPFLVNSKDKELFELRIVPQNLKESPFLKTLVDRLRDRNLVEIPISDIRHDELDYLEQIFNKLEKQCSEDNFILKREINS